MTKTNTVNSFDIVKFMSDSDIEIANKSISKNEAAILYNAISLAGLHNFEEDISNLQDKLVKIMESK